MRFPVASVRSLAHRSRFAAAAAAVASLGTVVGGILSLHVRPGAARTCLRRRAAVAPRYVHRTRTSLGRAVRTAYRVVHHRRHHHAREQPHAAAARTRPNPDPNPDPNPNPNPNPNPDPNPDPNQARRCRSHASSRMPHRTRTPDEQPDTPDSQLDYSTHTFGPRLGHWTGTTCSRRTCAAPTTTSSASRRTSTRPPGGSGSRRCSRSTWTSKLSSACRRSPCNGWAS
eukprot:scaffold119678_cov57-Phaeocystis_antarctica.AAC.7